MKDEAADYDGFNNYIDGYEFRPVLDPHTSLEALEHYGEKIRGVPETELPNYGTARAGNWLPCMEEDRDSKHQNKAELRNLEFLKKFRETYESDLS